MMSRFSCLSVMIAALLVTAPPTQATQVQVHVSLSGLNLDTPQGAHDLIFRIRSAAAEPCGGNDVHDPYWSSRYDACIREAVSNVVKAVNRPLVTQAYVAMYPHDAARQHAQPPVVASN